MTATQQNILEILKLSTDYLTKNKLPSPRLEAELIISQILGCKRLDLYLRFDQPFKDNELEQIRALLKRRAAHEPLQHILGYTDFFGCRIKSDRRALIPRHDTEVLAEIVIEQAKTINKPAILDIGTGSGCIAIALAKNLTAGKIAALDISAEALSLAAENATENGVADQIIFAPCDILKPFKVKEKFDIIVSNPPYIAIAEMDGLDQEVKDYEPINALTDSDDGLTFYRRLAEIVPGCLKSGGWLIVEIGYLQAAAVQNIFTKSGFLGEIVIHKDLSGNDRVIQAKAR